MIRLSIRLVLLCSVLLFPSAPTVHAETLTNCTYTDFMNLLNSNPPGGTINFACSGTIVVPEQITITADTALNGNGQSVTFEIDGYFLFIVNPGVTLSLDNVTLTGLNMTTWEIPTAVIVNQGILRLNQVTIRDNFSEGSGSGIANSGSATILNSTLHNNVSNIYSGGAIGNSRSGQMEIVNSTISNNGGVGMGGAVDNMGTMRITNSTFDGNFSVGDGAALYNWGGTVEVTNTSFTHSVGENGAIVNDDGTMSLTNCTISNNWMSENALVNGGTLTVTNCTFDGNSAYIDSTSAFAQGSGSVVFRHTIIQNGFPVGYNCRVSGGTVDAQGNNQSDDDTCPGFKPLK